VRARHQTRIRQRAPHALRGQAERDLRAYRTFDDFWITCSNVSVPTGWASRIVLPEIVSEPGRWRSSCRPHAPASSAAAAVNGFIVEPGSNTSVSARLRIRSGATLPSRRLG